MKNKNNSLMFNQNIAFVDVSLDVQSLSTILLDSIDNSKYSFKVKRGNQVKARYANSMTNLYYKLYQ
jgi:hypothetical protein